MKTFELHNKEESGVKESTWKRLISMVWPAARFNHFIIEVSTLILELEIDAINICILK